MAQHHNGLSPAELERLALLAEEMAEAIHVIGKILRHGYQSFNPEPGECNHSNRKLLTKEVGDVIAAIDILVENDDLKHSELEVTARQKLSRVGKYLHYFHKGVVK